MPRLLIIEDDHALLNGIKVIFEEERYSVDTADNGADGLFLAEQQIYDLVVLDILLPGLDGLSILKKLRAANNRIPVILLTAKDSIQDRVQGLDSGADDYMVKPFAAPELLARARVMLRRHGIMEQEGTVGYKEIVLKPKQKEGFIGNKPLKLSAKEYELLEFFIVNKEQILTREQMFDRVWGFDSEANVNIVDLYVHYLRKKLSIFGCEYYIQTLRGVGFIFEDVPENVT